MAAMKVASYVAVGDSLSEGLDDPYPDGSGYRGWADLVADRLAARNPDFRYANLAIRGRLLPEIVAEQVPLAAELRPELFSITGGGNDVLRRHYDPAAQEALLAEAVGRLTAAGARAIAFTGYDLGGRIPGAARLRPRIRAVNAAITRIAIAHGAILVDLWSDRGLDDPRLWSEDRLHLAPAGHQRVAAHVLAGLGLPAEEAWLAPLPTAVPTPWARARIDDLRWARRHAAPWFQRRLTGRSSGDGRLPKRPTLAPLR
jgi:lysophospholipase L1-like esterase